jgi:type II secretory pathway pseudopilin PulG
MEERGQVLPLLAVVIVLAGLATVAVVRFGGVATDRGRASTAADAAALAGAAEGEQQARALAAANGARLLTYEELGEDTRVRVEVGSVSATARAERAGGGLDERLPPERRGVAPGMAAALARADQIIGGHVPVTRVHRPGFVVDIAPETARRLESLTAETGLCPLDGNSYSLCSPG